MPLRPARPRSLLVAVALIPLGLAAKKATGSWQWVADHAAGALYVAFFVFLALALIPRARVVPTAVLVFLATCGIECLQLWHPAPLESVRATTPGRLLLGSSFSWTDFPPYAVGATLAALAARCLLRGSSAGPR